MVMILDAPFIEDSIEKFSITIAVHKSLVDVQIDYLTRPEASERPPSRKLTSESRLHRVFVESFRVQLPLGGHKRLAVDDWRRHRPFTVGQSRLRARARPAVYG